MPTPPQWNGDLTFFNAADGTWFATDPNNERWIGNSVQLCNANVKPGFGGTWELWIVDNGGTPIWHGASGVMATPLGIYTRDNPSFWPETITIINNPDPVQATEQIFNCLPG